MHMKMISVLILILLSTQIRSQSFNCDQVVTKDGTYKGFQFYKHYGNSNETSYRLYRKGVEIVVELTSNGSLIVKDVETKADSNVKHKFGVYHGYGWFSSTKGFVNCLVVRKGEINFHTKCTGDPGDYENPNLKYPEEPIFVKPLSGSTDVYNVLVFDRKNKKDYSSLNLETWWYIKLRKIVQETCGPKNTKDVCKVPPFVTHMEGSLFANIEGVIDYSDGNKNGHIILFNINGRPKYCVTPEGEKLSKECEKSSQMHTLFDECFKPSTVFQTTLPTNTLNTTEPSEESTNTKFWIIFALLVIGGILAIGIIGIIIYQNNKKTEPKTTSNGKTSVSASGHPSSSIGPKLTSETLIKSSDTVASN